MARRHEQLDASFLDVKCIAAFREDVAQLSIETGSNGSSTADYAMLGAEGTQRRLRAKQRV
jgi:hypothetical protein